MQPRELQLCRRSSCSLRFPSSKALHLPKNPRGRPLVVLADAPEGVGARPRGGGNGLLLGLWAGGRWHCPDATLRRTPEGRAGAIRTDRAENSHRRPFSRVGTSVHRTSRGAQGRPAALCAITGGSNQGGRSAGPDAEGAGHAAEAAESARARQGCRLCPFVASAGGCHDYRNGQKDRRVVDYDHVRPGGYHRAEPEAVRRGVSRQHDRCVSGRSERPGRDRRAPQGAARVRAQRKRACRHPRRERFVPSQRCADDADGSQPCGRAHGSRRRTWRSKRGARTRDAVAG